MAAHRKYKPIEIDDTFGLLTVKSGPIVKRSGRFRRVFRKCDCQCGTSKEFEEQNLNRGSSQSCGCACRDLLSTANKIHGESHTPLNYVWISMKGRCSRPSDKAFKNYGARGIRVAQEWSDSYESFRDWAVANGYREGLTLERKDNNGDYSPENCTWIPRCDQAKNRRMNVTVTAFGESKIVSEWAKDPRCTVQYDTLYMRIRRGMNAERAITLPNQAS